MSAESLLSCLNKTEIQLLHNAHQSGVVFEKSNPHHLRLIEMDFAEVNHGRLTLTAQGVILTTVQEP